MSRLIAPLAIGLIGIGILIWLGTWQIQRLAWKEGVLAQIDGTIGSAPAPLPVLISPDEQKYKPVQISGQMGAQALYVLVSVKRQGAGWRVISALSTDDGRRVLVDRGFTPVARKEAATPQTPVTLLGNLHWPDDRNSSTPPNDVAGNIWYARDIAAMAETLGTEPLLVISRQQSPADPGITPLPVNSSGIPNNHLQYAITWFSLAVVWALMTALWARRRLKEGF